MSQLTDLYLQMSEHTKGVCGGPTCYKDPKHAAVNRCCSPEYCEMAEIWAKQFYGVTLERTGHKTLPFMGPNGCTVEPHLRPVCTVHACCINSLGYHPTDKAWTARYFDIRNAIELLELGETDGSPYDQVDWAYFVGEDTKT